ncbi:MAG: DUF1501 domain-containing protein [Verrucomicrobiales bacterium]|nr:DUF1501 domain-containing protein [Verrucomicrobiales bacterium]
MNPLANPSTLNRRDFLYGLTSSLGSLALTSQLHAEATSSSPLAPKKPMFAPKAKRVIMLFMEGGPSQVDTFDPKPELTRLHVTESKRTTGLANGKRFYVGSPFGTRKVGKSGIDMCDQWQHLAHPDVADELCVYRGCQAESLNHPEALFHMNTGSRLGGDPGIGSWVNYGFGTMNQNLPGYVVMTELALPQGGPGNWTNAFLPAYYQGTRLRTNGSPILDLEPPSFKTRKHQRRALDQLAKLNAKHAAAHPEHADLAARMESYELAYRMQTEVPDIADIASEPQHIKDMYGIDGKQTGPFAKQCLMARRLVEKGTRFVQVFSGGWDSHDYLERGHSSRIKSVDQPIAALIRDLKSRGLLEDTIVMWTGEFGRTPDNNYRGGVTSLGRGHNIDAMNMWFAGGGFKKGAIVGATDDIGAEAVDVVHPVRDVHTTLLHQLGLHDAKLTYFHGGRYKQLSQFGGQVIQELLA